MTGSASGSAHNIWLDDARRAHHSIGQLERSTGPLRRIYTIITSEIPGIDPESALQMAFKAINDSVGPNGLVPTLLVFGAYPRMTELDAPSPSITQRATAMRKAMDEVKKITASRQIRDALNMGNGPSTTSLQDLPLNSPVLVFREDNAGRPGSWKGPFNLIGLDWDRAIVELSSGPTNFRITSVKSYHHQANDEDKEKDNSEMKIFPSDDGSGQPGPDNLSRTIDETHLDDHTPEHRVNTEIAPLTESAPTPVQPVKRGRGRPRKFLINVNLTESIDPESIDPDTMTSSW